MDTILTAADKQLISIQVLIMLQESKNIYILGLGKPSKPWGWLKDNWKM